MTAMSRRLLTVDEAADYLNVTPRFVRRLVSDHRIAVHRLGRQIRFAIDDLDAYIDRGRVEAAEPFVPPWRRVEEGWRGVNP
jgi:excisionase family DNA binding protein